MKSPAPDVARDRIIDAAEACLRRVGAAKMTLDDVATTAGVHRATVYRHFEGGRDAVLLAVVERDAKRFMGRIARHVAGEPTLADAIVEAIVYSVEATLKHPILAILFAPETSGRTGGAAAASQSILELTKELWSPFVLQAQARDEARADLDLDHLAELILRLTFSLMSGPSPVRRSREETKRFLIDVIAPAVTGGLNPTRSAGSSSKPAAPAAPAAPPPRRVPASGSGGTADRLLETAAGLFLEKGYAQSSTRELAELLGIRKASLYHHIRTKEDLLEGLCLESLRRLTEEVEAGVWTSESPLRTLIEVHLAVASRDREMHLAMLLEHGALSPERRAKVVARRDAYALLVRSVVAAEQEAGRIRTDIEAKFLALALLNIVNWTIFWFDPDGPRPVQEIAAMLADVFLEGAAGRNPSLQKKKPIANKGE